MKDNIFSYVKGLFGTGFFHIFGSSVINKLVNFFSSVILVRLLTREEYGIFTYVWNIYSIVMLVNGLGIDSALLQLCSENNEKRNFCEKVTTYATRFGIRFNIVICLCLITISFYAPLLYSGSNLLLRLLCFLPIFQLLFNLTCIVLRYQKRNKEYSILTTINTVALLFASVVGVSLFKEKGLVLGYYFAYTISIVVGYFVFKVVLFANLSELDKHDRRGLISIGFVTVINNGISELLYLFDVFILGIVACDETILASYKIATNIPTALTFIPRSLMIYMYPYFAERRDNKDWCLQNYKRILLVMGGVNFMLTMIMFIGADTIITLLYGNKYADAVPVFRLLAINYFITGTFRIISGNLLVTQRKLKFNTAVAISSGVVNVIADFFFIQMWGSIGAALATILVVVVSSIMSTSYLVYTFRQNT